MLCRITSVVFLTVLLELRVANGFQGKPFPSLRSSPLSVSSEVEENASTEERKIEESVPYAVSRGDGTKGGGGLAMPKVTEEEDDGLRRPKVGADMPVGRPSWFRVPGPSQGMEELLVLYVSLESIFSVLRSSDSFFS